MQSFSPQITAPTGNYWHWQGHEIYYVRAGQPQPDRPSLLLVHGFGASTDHWRKNIEGLQDQFQVWAIDLLGFGRSAKPALEYSGQLWEQQLLDFIDQVIGEKNRGGGQFPRGLRFPLCGGQRWRQNCRGGVAQ